MSGGKSFASLSKEKNWMQRILEPLGWKDGNIWFEIIYRCMRKWMAVS
jgi:hypothetical protein